MFSISFKYILDLQDNLSVSGPLKLWQQPGKQPKAFGIILQGNIFVSVSVFPSFEGVFPMYKHTHTKYTTYRFAVSIDFK